ncbi:LysM peptidoglycan-binding domain-containing protein [Arcanobacterium haemolyticum]|nr:LysM peptidoglycan-binding domain-containing protein [Arcanobacterium haemolyticum]
MKQSRAVRASGAVLAATTALGFVAPASQAAPHHPSTDTSGNLALARSSAPEKHATLAMSYQVASGDTLASISQRTGTDISVLARANKLAESALLRAGQLLQIPVPSHSRTVKLVSHETTECTVEAGDTLSSIAQRYGSTVAALASANGIANPDRIYVGQKLTIPGSSAPASTPAAASTPTPVAAGTYTVAQGDTLSSIARQFGTSVAAIAAANGISNPNRIYVGQVLSIAGAASATPVVEAPAAATTSSQTSTPAPAASGTYTVASGDTLSSIARKLGTTTASLASANGISNPNRIYVGQVLSVSGSTSTSSAPSAGATGSSLVPNTFLGYTYSDATVAAANHNKSSLNSSSVPSRAQMQQIVRDVAVQMGVDPSLALAHAYVESGFDARAVSPANAVGVMQVIPSSGEWASTMVGRDLNLLDPYDNAVAGVAIIRWLQRNADSLDQGIAGYYQGLGGVRKNGMKSDTRTYVAKVRSAMSSF